MAMKVATLLINSSSWNMFNVVEFHPRRRLHRRLRNIWGRFLSLHFHRLFQVVQAGQEIHRFQVGRVGLVVLLVQVLQDLQVVQLDLDFQVVQLLFLNNTKIICHIWKKTHKHVKCIYLVGQEVRVQLLETVQVLQVVQGRQILPGAPGDPGGPGGARFSRRGLSSWLSGLSWASRLARWSGGSWLAWLASRARMVRCNKQKVGIIQRRVFSA
uniref:Candidate secreted effector n=1 Tax=Meloidogyne incognita TaxID=6306 RepID=A0A914LKT9_MELIC